MNKGYLLITFDPKGDDRKIISREISELANVVYLHDIPKEKIKSYLESVDVILTGSGLDLGREILALTKNLKMIQTLSAGADYIPFDSIPEHVIICTNSGANAPAVAEHVFGLILLATKKILYHHENMRKGVWKRREYGDMLRGKILGIIGFGSIGREVARIAKCLGMIVYGINRSGKTDVPVDFIGTPEDMDFVLKNSDIILISVPLNKYTANLIGSYELSLMKSDAILVNVSRGKVIDQKALYEHLKRNEQFIACLDVWWKYPKKGGEICFQDYPFHKLHNVIMTPHIAGFAKNIRNTVIIKALENIKRFLLGEKPMNIVRREDYI